MIGVLTMHLHLPTCLSLKEKRSRLKPLLHRLHREFNISAAEVDFQDAWQEAVIACALVSNDSAHAQAVLQRIVNFTATNWPDMDILDHRIECL
ncbi:hypothetical protein SE15_08580 [Thermanaerothrix daxensis]|uniref:YlxP-like protein n=1 Tax=Thermanaerothrix daxensis TaxID=869279 RepID=A0A0P6YE65_9CHLR|nr:DUF503 domain-containing protein [Thermanaerothrix daxensis]KPL83275.1 hypothetical protein SE15_08580 [Thermanaerothrix daxensis]